MTSMGQIDVNEIGTIDFSLILNMSDNLSFVLRSIEHVVYEDRPIPESTLECTTSIFESHMQKIVSDHDVLVEVKKTG